MKKYVCECCGGQINPVTLKCEYCGTQYKDDFDNIIRVETYMNPVDTYRSQVIVPRNIVQQMGDKMASEYVIGKLTRELSDVIAKNMVITARNSMETDAQVFSGTIKIIRPERIEGSGWYS